jgi:hypothetical protein
MLQTFTDIEMFSRELVEIILAKLSLNSMENEQMKWQEGEWYYRLDKHFVQGKTFGVIDTMQIFVGRQNYLWENRAEMPPGSRVQESAIVYRESETNYKMRNDDGSMYQVNIATGKPNAIIVDRFSFIHYNKGIY